MKRLLLLSLIVGLFTVGLSGCQRDLPQESVINQTEDSSASIPEEEQTPIENTNEPVQTPIKEEANKNSAETPITEQNTNTDSVKQSSKPQQAQQAQKPDTSSFIGETRAKEIALSKAGLSASEIVFEKVKLDRDDGVWEYEIEFRKGNVEYDFEIKANDGKILSYDKDIDD